MEEKFSQGNLFPKGSKGNPYSKNPRAQSAKRKRDYKKAEKETNKAKEVSNDARKREWKRRVDRGEAFGDMPADFNLFKDAGRNTLKILKTAAALTQIPTTMLRTGLTISGLGGRM